MSEDQLEDVIDHILSRHFSSHETSEIQRILERRESINERLKDARNIEEYGLILKSYPNDEYTKENAFML